MKSRIIGQDSMIAVCILAALTVLFSATFEQEAARLLSEANTEAQEAGQEKQPIFIAPSDAVTSSQAVEVEAANPFVVQEIITEVERRTMPLLPHIQLPASVVITLLQSVISPQAP